MKMRGSSFLVGSLFPIRILTSITCHSHSFPHLPTPPGGGMEGYPESFEIFALRFSVVTFIFIFIYCIVIVVFIILTAFIRFLTELNGT